MVHLFYQNLTSDLFSFVAMAIVPQEIIFNILSKLPVKSLCRFKCVSKSFLVLFSDPFFIKTHYLSQTQKDKLLVLHKSYLYLIDPETSTNDKKLIAKRIYFLKDRVYFIGSCNGLCCFCDPESRVYFFYNPSTRESSKEVPPCMKENCISCYYRGGGFGYAPSIDDYKMVIVHGWKHMTHVFSLRNNSWKTIHQHEKIHLRKGTPLNGALHWLSYCPKKVVSFDLVEEKFKSFPLPYYFQSNFSILNIVDGCLCLLVTKGKHNCEIWVMKEYGAVDSWTRIMISKEHLEKSIYQSNYLNLKLCLNGEMAFLLEDGDGLIPILCYQEIDGTWKEVEVDRLPALVFTESLVSPNWYIGEATNKFGYVYCD